MEANEMKTRIITHISVENPFYFDNKFDITFYRKDYQYNVDIVNKYCGVTESSLSRLDRLIPKHYLIENPPITVPRKFF